MGRSSAAGEPRGGSSLNSECPDSSLENQEKTITSFASFFNRMDQSSHSVHFVPSLI